MIKSKQTAIPLHTVPNYYEKAFSLLNQEWERKDDSWMTSIKNSNDQFPVNLVIIDPEKEECIAHCKLSIATKENSILIESVVVDKKYRGLGYGRLIMEEAESYIKERGFTNMVLSTHDKMEFYRHLGYNECEPVSTLGSNSKFLNNDQVSALLKAFGGASVKGLQKDGRTWMNKLLS